MIHEKDIIKDISSIKEMMQKSSRFISLSGLSGVLAGVYSLIGAYLANQLLIPFNTRGNYSINRVYADDITIKLFGIATIIIILATSTGILLTSRRAKKQGLSIWDYQAKRLIANLLIPLITGGVFCVILLFQNKGDLIAPITLIFYGLALIHASKYTLGTIKYLGFIEVSLGLLATVFLRNGLFFWTLGFGVMHIIYGLFMYFKYERNL